MISYLAIFEPTCTVASSNPPRIKKTEYPGNALAVCHASIETLSLKWLKTRLLESKSIKGKVYW